MTNTTWEEQFEEKFGIYNPEGYVPGSNCLQKPYNIHRNRLKTLAFYY